MSIMTNIYTDCDDKTESVRWCETENFRIDEKERIVTKEKIFSKEDNPYYHKEDITWILRYKRFFMNQ